MSSLKTEAKGRGRGADPPQLCRRAINASSGHLVVVNSALRLEPELKGVAQEYCFYEPPTQGRVGLMRGLGM